MASASNNISSPLPHLRRSKSQTLINHLFRLLQQCRTTNHLSQLHAHLITHGFAAKNFLLAKLLSSYIAAGNLTHAALAFTHARHPSTTLFNLLIKATDNRSSFLLYKQMRSLSEADSKPNGFTYTFLLSSCAGSRLRAEGTQLHAAIVRAGFSSNVFVQTNLLNMYAAVEDRHSALKLFNQMPHRNVVSWNAMLAGCLRSGDVMSAFRMFDEMPERDVVSWTTMIAGCAQSGKSRQALALFREMRRAGVHPDQVAMVAALTACADMGDLELGRWIHGCVKGNHRLVSLDNALINMYVKCGDPGEGRRVFEGMLKRSTASWTTMISGLTMHGRGSEALEMFQRMQRAGGDEPDGVTYIGVLGACSHTGRVEEGRRYFGQMIKQWGIMPRIEHYGCMVDMLSRAGRLSEAWELIDTMPMQPNEAVWGALLNGCRMHRDVELAAYTVEKLMELEPDNVAGYLVILSNAYSSSKRWGDVRRVRERMVQARVSKPAGRSWVHVNRILHDFVAGDRSHLQAPQIYKMVAQIVAGAKLVGLLPDTSQVLLDVDDEEEREALMQQHSEKLALAFALISSSSSSSSGGPGVRLDPIRIMSNQRICSDCHSFGKYVSEAFCREIIIRDQNRFHHFVGGACSCRDYW